MDASVLMPAGGETVRAIRVTSTQDGVGKESSGGAQGRMEYHEKVQKSITRRQRRERGML
jgi:hypothetical protein